MADQSAPDRTYWLFVVVAIAAAVLVSLQLLAHGVPVASIFFVAFTSTAGGTLILDHFRKAIRRARQNSGGAR